MMNTRMSVACLSLILAAPLATAQPDWSQAEAHLLTDHLRLTSPAAYARAGEAYFAPSIDGAPPQWIIYQATNLPPEGQPRSPHYDMHVARLLWSDDGDRITGIGAPIRVNAPDSANTCGWFHPTIPGRILFGSTRVTPSEDNVPGYQRGTGTYAWAFPTEMDIMIADIVPDAASPAGYRVTEPMRLFARDGYTAEGSWSPDGRFVLYAQVDDERSRTLGRPDADLWIFDAIERTHTPIVVAQGYDGGPFFDASGTRITYRSDRRGDNLLQLFTADLAFGPSGTITGITRETQITDNQDVNWAPYFHPSGAFLVFTGSQHGHFNYEVVAVEANASQLPEQQRVQRVTNAAGFDGLPVFTPDGRWMMWTSQRDPDTNGSGTSQLWVARVVPHSNEAINRFLNPTPDTMPGVPADLNPFADDRMNDDMN